MKTEGAWHSVLVTLHFSNCTGHTQWRQKPVSPRASSSVSTSVMYLKSMHDTICFGSWIDKYLAWYFPCDYIPDINRWSKLSLTHHVHEQLPQRLWKKSVSHDVSCFMKETKFYLLSFIWNFPTLPSALAQRSHTAFRTAAVARWITPFSGPNCTRRVIITSSKTGEYTDVC